jgi:hypothetical protein
MAWNAWYMAGRGRSFMAASTMQKFFCSPGLRYSTSVRHTGVAHQRAAGFDHDLAVPKPRASSLASSLGHKASAAGRRVAVVVDAQAAAEVDVADRMPAASMASTRSSMRSMASR